MHDTRDQIIRDDDTTLVRFSLVGGHGLFDAGEVIARDGLASVALQGLGIAGLLTVRVEAPGLETAELELYAAAAALYRIAIVALPATILADRNSTTMLSAVVRDSLGNVVVDSSPEIRFGISGHLSGIIGPQIATTTEGNAQTSD